jgi:hypothetical protein
MDQITRTAAASKRSQGLSSPMGRTTRWFPSPTRQDWWLVFVAAFVAVSSVAIGTHVEDRLLRADPVASTTVVDSPVDMVPTPAPSIATLVAGSMTLEAVDATVAITSGPRAADTPFTLRTTRIGSFEPGTPMVTELDSEVRLSWDGVTEWYRALDSDEMEHGYTIDAPLHDNETLEITVAVGAAQVIADGADLMLVRDGAPNVWYRNLYVFDATGRTLPSAMTADAATIEIVVDTTDAVYPITVDPVLSEFQVIRAANLALATAPNSASVGGPGGSPNSAACPDGSLMTGIRTFQSPESVNWLRAANPRCRTVVLEGAAISLSGATTDGPVFGNPEGALAPEERDCAAGSVVVGFNAAFGTLVDRVSLTCASLESDGSLGTPTSLPPSGGTGGPFSAAVSCLPAVGSGLFGSTGEDLDQMGLLCTAIVPGGASGDRFGSAVDIVGDRMVVSAPAADAGAVDAGLIRVFGRAGAGSPWEVTAEIASPLPELNGRFGDAVALSPDGTRIAVGESDRLGDLAEPGRVFVFEETAGVWNQLGGAIAASPPAGPDGFGASLAWAGNDRLVIGAPFAGGTGAVYDHVVGGALTPIGFAPSVGDEFGFSVAVDARTGGGYRLVVGSPGWTGQDGGGVLYPDIGKVDFFTDRATGAGFVISPVSITSPLGLPVRLGGSVAIAGDRVAFGSSGGPNITGTLYRTENDGVNWIGETTVSVPKPIDTPDLSNRFVAIEGGTLALGVPGGGGSVALFRTNGFSSGGVWPTSPSALLQPAGVETGDWFGWAIALDRGTLVAGAPNDDGADNTAPQVGAVYSASVPIVATFTAADDFDWTNAANWDVGVVPGTGDFAIVPQGTLAILGNDDVAVGRLRVRGDLIVEVGATLTIDDSYDGSSIIDATGDLFVNNDSQLRLTGELVVESGGRVITQAETEGLGAGVLTLDGAVNVGGGGLITNSGVVEKIGAGALVVGGAITWNNADGSSFVLAEGDANVFTTSFDAQGEISVAPGTTLRLDGNLDLAPSSRLSFGVSGPSNEITNYGRIVLPNGFVNPDGAVAIDFFDEYDISVDDSYPVITCLASNCNDGSGFFSAYETFSGGRVLDIIRSFGGWNLEVVGNKIIADDAELTGFGFDVAVDGDWAVVGETTAVPGSPGRAYVMRRDGGTGAWEVVQLLGGDSGNFGRAVDIDGDLIVVASWNADPTFGRYFVYRRIAEPLPEGPFFELVYSNAGGRGDVAVAGDTVFAGRPELAPPRVDIVRLSPANAVLGFANLQPSGTGGPAFGGFGRSIDVVRTGPTEAIAVVGAPTALTQQGRAYVFEQSAGVWTQTDNLGSPDIAPTDRLFGSAVAISENTLVVGQSQNSTPIGDAGAVFVYGGEPGSYAGPQKLQASNISNSDTFGTSVAIDGDVLVVGAGAAQKANFPLRDGATYVFERLGGVWAEREILRAPDGFDQERFGDSLAISNGNLLVGASNDTNANGSGAGAVYSYSVDQPVPVAVPPSALEFSVGTSTPTPQVGLSTIEIADLPASAFQGYGGRTSEYARSDLQTLDLRADLGAPNAAETPVADVTLDDLALDTTPITQRLLGSILLAELPIAGGWSAKLQPGGPLLVEQSLSLLDVYDPVRYPGVAGTVRLGDLTLTSSNLGSMSTYAALLAGKPVDQLPVPSGTTASAYWCGQVEAAGLSCESDFGVTNGDVSALTLPVLSLAGVDVEAAALLGAPLVDADGAAVNLSGTPIGDRELGSLNLGVVPLASQPLVPSKSLPSFLPPTLAVPEQFLGITLGELGGAAPLAALAPVDVGLAGEPVSSLDLTHNPESPLDDYLWVPPAAGASLLLSQEGPLPSAIAAVPVADLGLDAPVLAVPLDELVLPNGRTLGSYRVSELAAAEAPFGASPFGASPFGASPFGASPFGASPFGASPFGASPFGASPFGASPFGASPFGASPFGASPFGASPFGASPFGASPFGASPFGASPFGASPFGASPFGASPFGASPFGASPFGASPFGASPFGASPFGASPLSELGLAAPITAIPLTGTVGGRQLGDYLLSELDPTNFLFDLPLAPFVGWERFDCDVIDCRQPYGFTIADGLAAGAFTSPENLTLADVQPGLFGLTVADLIGAHPAFTRDALGGFVASIGLTLADAEAAGLGVSNIPVELLARYQTITIDEARLAFSGWRLIDLVGLAVGLDEDDVRAAVDGWAAATAADPTTLGDLTGKLATANTGGLGDALWLDTLALSTVVKAAPGLTVDDVWPLLRPLRLEHLRLAATGATPPLGAAAAARTVGNIISTDPSLPVPSQLEGLLWGDIIGSAGTQPLTAAEDVTVADIVGGFAGITLGEFLRAAQPISDQRTEQIDLRSINLAEYGSGVPLAFEANIEVVGGNRPQSVRVVVTLPDGSRYVPESATLAGGPAPVDVEPTRFGDTLVWQLANLQPDVAYTLDFEATSAVRIGTVGIAGAAQIPSAGLFVQASATVEYVEAFEPNDTPAQAGPIDPNQIVLTQISSATDVDLFRFEVTEPGERIGAVLWNLPADYDLTIIGPSAPSLTDTSGRIFESVGDSQAPLTGGAPAATLADAGQYRPPAELSVIARSTRRGTAPEIIEPIPTFTTGTYYLVVSGYDGASSDQPYGLRLLKETPPLAAPVCGNPVSFPFAAATGRPSATSIPAGANTLFVVNDARFARQYGAAAATNVLTAINTLTSAVGPGGTLSSLGLTAGVLDLGGVSALTSRYAAWDAEPCKIDLANRVVSQTVSELTSAYAANPGIEYVVIVGSDKIVPFARLADRTLLGNEQNYAATFSADRSSPLYAALQAGTYFSDDPYVDPTPSLVNDRALYVVEKSIGRLVEDPDSIIGQLETFVTLGGAVRVDSAVVTGYDFLADSSDAIADILGPVVDPANVDTLISETWTSEDLDVLLFPSSGTGTGIGAINGHFSHQGTQAANGSRIGDQTDALFVEDIGQTSFTGSLLFTVGCHSGLSVSENLPGAIGADWAEALGAAGASAYLAQTGFGYGSTDSIALTERLLVNFARRLDGNFTIGEALKLAKNEYVRPLASISVYDEKSLQQAVLFGLPFSTPAVANPPQPGGAPVDLVGVPVPGLGDLQTASITPEYQIEPRITDRGTIFEIDGQSYAAHEQPLQPITTVDTTVDGTRIRGAILRGGSAYRVPGTIDPVYLTPTINSSEREPELQPTDALYPISPLGVTDALTEFGRRDYTIIMPGRFQATEANGDGIQVLYEALQIQTLHSPDSPDNDDWTPPSIGQVNQTVVNGSLLVAVDSPDTDVAGVVVSLVENLPDSSQATPAAWRSFDLGSSGDGRWTGITPLSSSCTDQVDYLVQIYDTSGNVNVMSNKAAGFSSSCDDDTVAEPPADDELVVAPRTAPLPSGWYPQGPVVVDVTSTFAGPFTYQIGDDPPVVVASAPFEIEITGSGELLYTVTALDGLGGVAVVAGGTLLIDDGLAPRVLIASPSAADVETGQPVSFDFGCTDASLVSCVGTLTGPGTPVNVSSGQTLVLLAGSYQLDVVGVDAVGRQTTESRTFAVVDPVDPVDPALVFEGFFSPVAPDDPAAPTVFNAIKSTQTVPLKWRIYTADGQLVTSTAGITVTHRLSACVGSPETFEVTETEASSVGGGLKFTGDQFQFNFKPDRKWKGKCGQITVTYGDGQTAKVLFQYR